MLNRCFVRLVSKKIKKQQQTTNSIFCFAINQAEYKTMCFVKNLNTFFKGELKTSQFVNEFFLNRTISLNQSFIGVAGAKIRL